MPFSPVLALGCLTFAFFGCAASALAVYLAMVAATMPLAGAAVSVLGAAVALAGAAVSVVILAVAYQLSDQRHRRIAVHTHSEKTIDEERPETVADLRVKRANVYDEMKTRLTEYSLLLNKWKQIAKKINNLSQSEENREAMDEALEEKENLKPAFIFAQGRYYAARERVHDINKEISHALKCEKENKIKLS